MRGSISRAAAAGSVPRSSQNVHQNVLPFPASLRTPISPFISSTSCFEMESPRPVPPKRRVVERSACA
jgi:hypothetical protein